MLVRSQGLRGWHGVVLERDKATAIWSLTPPYSDILHAAEICLFSSDNAKTTEKLPRPVSVAIDEVKGPVFALGL